MSSIPAPRDQWYVIHVLSGHERKVLENIRYRLAAEEMGDLIFEVIMPTELVSEVKRGKKSESRRKFFPGYIIMNMHLLHDDSSLVERTWYFVQETPGVIRFAGTKDKPLPLRPKEVEQMLAQVREREEGVRPKIQFDVGDRVKVADGPFESQVGVVEEIDLDRGKLRVAVDIFGRSTPVELEYWQVERA
jgi:transcription termination/antitermination protein NusG